MRIAPGVSVFKHLSRSIPTADRNIIDVVAVTGGAAVNELFIADRTDAGSLVRSYNEQSAKLDRKVFSIEKDELEIVNEFVEEMAYDADLKTLFVATYLKINRELDDII